MQLDTWDYWTYIKASFAFCRLTSYLWIMVMPGVSAPVWVHVTGKLTVQLDTEHGAGAGAGRALDPEKKQFITGIREL